MDENSCSTVRDWCFWDASPKACFGTTNIRYPPYKTKAECENNGKEWKDDDTHIASCKRRPGIYSRVDSNGWKLSSGTYKICVHNYLPSWGFSTTSSAIVAGGFSRLVAGTVVAPFELIRTQMQSSASEANMGMTRKLLKNVRSNGFASLYRGLKPTLWRDVPFSVLYWSFYERFREMLDVVDNLFLRSFLAGASAGSIAAFATTPFDVIKTRQQVDIFQEGNPVPFVKKDNVPKGTFELASKITREEGIPRLFTGVTPRVVKVAPACAIMIATYEIGKSYFGVETYDSE